MVFKSILGTFLTTRSFCIQKVIKIFKSASNNSFASYLNRLKEFTQKIGYCRTVSIVGRVEGGGFLTSFEHHNERTPLSFPYIKKILYTTLQRPTKAIYFSF